MSDAIITRIGWDTSGVEAGRKRAMAIAQHYAAAVDKMLGGIGRDLAGAAFGVGLLSFTKDAIKSAAALEGMTNSLTMVMGGADEAAVEMEKLREAAKMPGLDFNSLVMGSQRFQTLGYSADEARRILIELGNTAALSGLTQADVSDIIDALVDIGSAGQIADDKIDRLTERSALFSRVMKDTFGASTAEGLRAMGVTADDFLVRLAGGLSELQRADFNSTANQLKNADEEIKKLSSSIGTTLMPAVRTSLEGFDKLTKVMAEAWGGAESLFNTLSSMMNGVSYEDAVQINQDLAESERRATEEIKKRVEAQQKAAADARVKSAGSDEASINQLRDAIQKLQGQEETLKRLRDSAAELRKVFSGESGKISLAGVAANPSAFSSEQVRAAAEYAKKMAEINKMLDADADKARQAEEKRISAAVANEELQAEIAIARAIAETKDEESEKVKKLQEELRVKQLARSLQQELNVSAERALELAREKVNAERAATDAIKARQQAEARIDHEQDLEVLRLKAAGREKEAAALERQLRISAEAKRLMESTGMSEDEALNKAREREDLLDKIKKREEQEASGRKRIQGYSQAMRERSQYQGDTRELDKYRNRGKSQFDQLQEKPSVLDQYKKKPMQQQAQNNADKRAAVDQAAAQNPMARVEAILTELSSTLTRALN